MSASDLEKWEENGWLIAWPPAQRHILQQLLAKNDALLLSEVLLYIKRDDRNPHMKPTARITVNASSPSYIIVECVHACISVETGVGQGRHLCVRCRITEKILWSIPYPAGEVHTIAVTVYSPRPEIT